MICAVGQELRDYPTLVEAVRGLDADVVIAAASPWSKRADTSAGLDIPANVTVASVRPVRPAPALRRRRARRRAAAGDRLPGRHHDDPRGDVDGAGDRVHADDWPDRHDRRRQTGRYVPVGDTIALRAAIDELLADPAEAARLGGSGQRWVRAHADVATYADDLAQLLRST